MKERVQTTGAFSWLFVTKVAVAMVTIHHVILVASQSYCTQHLYKEKKCNTSFYCILPILQSGVRLGIRLYPFVSP